MKSYEYIFIIHKYFHNSNTGTSFKIEILWSTQVVSMIKFKNYTRRYKFTFFCILNFEKVLKISLKGKLKIENVAKVGCNEFSFNV